MPDTRVQDEQGNIHVFPDAATPEMIAQALGVKPPSPGVNLKTGQGMEAQAQEQARRVFTGSGGQGNYDATGRQISGPNGTPLTLMEKAAQAQTDNQTRLGSAQNRAMQSPTPFTNTALPVFGGTSVGANIAQKGLKAAAKPLVKGVVGATAGSAAGSYGGRALGSLVNQPDAGGKIGAIVGGLAGGMAGGFGEPEPQPEVFPVSKSPGPYRGPKSVPKPAPEPEPEVFPVSASPGPYRGPSSVPKPPEPQPELGSPQNPGWMSKIPTRMPKAVAPEPELGTPDNPGWMSKLPTRMPKNSPVAEAQSAPGVSGSLPRPSGRLVVLPEEAQSLDQMNKIATKRAKDNGMLYAAGMRPAGGGRVPLTPTKTNTPEINAKKSPLPWETQATTATPPPLRVENAMGIRWATDGVNKVSIPNEISDEDLEAYARPKLAEQASIRSSLPWMKGNQ